MIEQVKEFWEKRYQDNDTGWDAGTITPPLRELADSIADKNAAILIPGCGNAHEAAYLLEKGFTNITLIDIAEDACKRIEATLGDYLRKSVHVICGDFFEQEGLYDIILEQTFFCAINPTLRKSYAAHMFRLLKPGGMLAGVLFNRDFEGGPPFGGHESEYRELFSRQFIIEKMEPCTNSIAPRAGAELLIQLRKPAL